MSHQLLSRLWSAGCSTFRLTGPLKSNLLGRLVTATKRIGISVAVLLASGATSPVLAGEAASEELSVAQVLRSVEAKYSALASYSDEGRVVITSVDGDSIVAFSIRLARPSFYRTEWRRSRGAISSPWEVAPEAVWSSGAYNLLSAGGCPVRRQFSREIALAQAAGPSGGAAATIPQRFFKWKWGDHEERFDDVVSSTTRQSDENVGNINCYVFTTGAEGRTNTLWIGKQDFLIRQVQTVISKGAMQAMTAGLLKNLDPERIRALHGFTFTETHTNIVLNPQFSRSDFIPSFTLFGSSYED